MTDFKKIVIRPERGRITITIPAHMTGWEALVMDVFETLVEEMKDDSHEG